MTRERGNDFQECGPSTLMGVLALLMVKHLPDGVLSHDLPWKDRCHVWPMAGG